MTSEPLADCEKCQHYRPQVSFVDAWKRFDQSSPYLPVMRSLQEVRKAETETLENEVELLFELVRAEEALWPERPRFAPVCGVRGETHVAALKNRDGRCADYQIASGREDHGCFTCRFVTLPESNIGDRKESMSGGMGEGERNALRQRNKDIEEADATAQGLEIEQSFFGDGRLPVVRFLPTCSVRMQGGVREVVPFCNVRRDCPEHSPYLKVPKALMQKQPTEPEGPALDATIALAVRIADAGIDHPGAFLEASKTWIAADPARQIAVPWIAVTLGARWLAQTPGDKEALAKALQAAPFRASTGTSVLPVIAGADAFEWGLIARLSRMNDAAAATAANAILQQLAEFLVSIVHPAEGARCIESARALTSAPGLFAPVTLEILDPYLRRMNAMSDSFRTLARTDLLLWYEGIAAGLSYAVSEWLRLRHKDSGLGAILGPGFDARRRDRLVWKLATAKEHGTMILERVSHLDDLLWPSPPAEFIAQLGKDNETLLRTDADEELEIMTAILGFADRTISGGMPVQADPLAAMLGLGSGNAVKKTVTDRWQATATLQLPRRKLFAALRFLRGAAPITPSALELWGKPPAKHPPETLDQAVLDPVSKNMESFYPPPNDVAAAFLRIGRRTGSPVIRSDPAKGKRA